MAAQSAVKSFICACAGTIAWLLGGTAALAADAGSVTHLTGTLSAQKADGAVRILARRSEVNPGDTLTTEKDSFAQIDFPDGSAITIRPSTRVKLEAYRFDAERPQEDTSFLRLIKGGIRSVSGLIGKRGSEDAFRIGTATATIGIRGSSGDTFDCTQGCEGVTSTSDKLDKAVYHTTYTGSYVMINDGGELIVGEGRFGYATDIKLAPVLLPGDPGMSLGDLPFTLGTRDSRSSGQECTAR